MPTLYLVGTPIGNLEDITLRALRILAEVSLIAAEDTRTTGRLLSHFEIETPMLSYHDFSGTNKISKLINQLDEGDVALVSEAGMPGLSDPGFRLVQAAIEANIQIVPVPGPTAAVSALVASGLPTDRFLFLGYLPRRSKRRIEALEDCRSLPFTLIFYEAPHRLIDLLKDMKQILGDRRAAVGREMTKLYEEIWRGKLSEAESHFGRDKVRGEFTLVVAGAEIEDSRWEEEKVLAAANKLVEEGFSRKEAARQISGKSGWRQREIYHLLVGSES